MEQDQGRDRKAIAPMDEKFKYDRRSSTSKQAIAEKILITMSHNRTEEGFEIIDAPEPRHKEIIQIPWTAETLMNSLQLWDATISLQKINDVLDGLVSCGYVIRRKGMVI